MTVSARGLVVLRGIAVAAVCGLPLPSVAQIVVSNTNDAGAGSLRDAITAANAAPGATTIAFNIPPGDDAAVGRQPVMSPVPELCLRQPISPHRTQMT